MPSEDIEAEGATDIFEFIKFRLGKKIQDSREANIHFQFIKTCI